MGSTSCLPSSFCLLFSAISARRFQGLTQTLKSHPRQFPVLIYFILEMERCYLLPPCANEEVFWAILQGCANFCLTQAALTWSCSSSQLQNKPGGSPLAPRKNVMLLRAGLLEPATKRRLSQCLLQTSCSHVCSALTGLSLDKHLQILLGILQFWP